MRAIPSVINNVGFVYHEIKSFRFVTTAVRNPHGGFKSSTHSDSEFDNSPSTKMLIVSRFNEPKKRCFNRFSISLRFHSNEYMTNLPLDCT